MASSSSRNSSSHGGIRGADFNRQSSQFEGRFGRIFRSLPPAVWPESALIKLAGDGLQDNCMSAPPERDETNPKLPTAPSEDGQSSRLHYDEENSGRRQRAHCGRRADGHTRRRQGRTRPGREHVRSGGLHLSRPIRRSRYYFRSGQQPATT